MAKKTEPQLVLRNIGKTFANGITALRDINLTVQNGDFLTLLGPSGCGKSTALRIISGLISPTEGTVDWHGPELHPGDIGFIFQEPTLMPWATVFENTWLPLRLRGFSRKQAEPQIAEALGRVHLTGFENAVPRELSGGMKMRVSIARGLVTRPRILLMDEPFAALDEITRFKLNNDLLELWKDQRFTVIFVTHSVFESVFLSNRIAVLTPRPGQVHTQIEIDAPYPRQNSFRTTTRYAEFCGSVSEALSQAMGQETIDGR